MFYKPDDFIGGKYRIIEAIGSGAMGDVYKAENVNMSKAVCIKVLNAEAANHEEYLHRFIREARAAATLDHSNICTINDFDIDRGPNGDQQIPYIVMEFLSGETLRQRIDRCGAMSPLEAVRIIRQLLNALSCAHDHGIVHRDVKPANIMLVEREGRKDFVKLIDFGIAHVESPDGDLKTLTQAGQIYGTPQYISPEQAQGDAVDFRADQYAAGIILYELLVGQPPFNSSNYIELLVKQVNEVPPHLPKHLPQSASLDAIIQKLIAKNPADRFERTSDILPMLDDILIQFSTNATDDNGLAILRQHAITLTGRAASISGVEAAVASEGARPRRITFVLVILAAVAAVVGIVTAVVMLTRKPPEVPPAQDSGAVASADAADPADAAPAEDAPPAPAPFDETEDGFVISNDEVLAKDTEILKIAEAYTEKKYTQAIGMFEALMPKYERHPNFLRLYILVCQKKKDDERVIENLGRLFEVEPNATRNPMIAEQTLEYFNSKDYYKPVKQAIYRVNNANAAANVAWLIIHSPYDRYELRLERLFEVYDYLPHGSVPEWLNAATAAWKPGKDQCAKRKAVLAELAADGREEYFEHVLRPMYEARSKECGKSKDCNECLKPWLKDVLAAHDKK